MLKTFQVGSKTFVLDQTKAEAAFAAKRVINGRVTMCFNLLPLKYQWAYDLYRTMKANHWDFGFKTCTVADLKGGSPEENIAMFSDMLVGGVSDGLMDTMCLSAGAALWVAGKSKDPSEGAVLARSIILNGALRDEARRLREAYRVA